MEIEMTTRFGFACAAFESFKQDVALARRGSVEQFSGLVHCQEYSYTHMNTFCWGMPSSESASLVHHD
eukprot:6196150-Pleurochrysis_carterae.AAC.3